MQTRRRHAGLGVTRVHIPHPPDADRALALPPPAVHHLLRVLRLKPGARLTLFTGDGREWPAEIVETAPRRVIVQPGPGDAIDRESPLDITLVQAIGKGRRMEYSLQKAVELGVRRIVPVLSRRCVVKLEEPRRENKREHWQAIAIAACEQCGRNRIPEVHPPVELNRYFETSPLQAAEQGLFLDPDGTNALSRLTRPTRIRVLIGPEGGFTDEERIQALENGYLNLRLGKRILRTETAGPAIIATLQTLWGDFA